MHFYKQNDKIIYKDLSIIDAKEITPILQTEPMRNTSL